MIWGCFSYEGVGNIEFISGNMTGQMYINILHKNLLESASNMGLQNNFIFMHDNDPKHTSKVASNYLASNHIEVFDHPSSSPDLKIN